MLKKLKLKRKDVHGSQSTIGSVSSMNGTLETDSICELLLFRFVSLVCLFAKFLDWVFRRSLEYQ